MSYQENVTHLGRNYFKSVFLLLLLLFWFFVNGLLGHLRKDTCPSLAVLLVLMASDHPVINLSYQNR